MANPTTPAKNVPASNKAPVTNVKPEEKPVVGPQLPTEEKSVEKKKTEKKAVQQIVWPTAEAAKAEANKRTYGPRKAYTVTIGNTTVHCVAYNDQYAAYEAFIAAGGTIDELGGTTRAKKAPSKEAILNAAQSMSPEQLAALKAELAKL
jgi:hypothetical protein